VDRESHLLELVRYIVLNPVRAGMVEQAGAWPWSSFRAMSNEAPEAVLARRGVASIAIWRGRVCGDPGLLSICAGRPPGSVALDRATGTDMAWTYLLPRTHAVFHCG
jgi:hypothetical protein